MRLFRSLACLLPMLCQGCDLSELLSEQAPPSATASSHQAVDPLVFRSRQLALRMQSALARLREPMPAANKFRERQCPDQEILSRGGSPASTVLTLATHDARYAARSLLPLRLTRPLESQEHAQLAAFFESTTDELTSPLLRELRSEADADSAARVIESLEQQAFKGVFHITLFKKPHLIRKKNRRRREWTQGVLQAWFVVYDIDSSEEICQTLVTTVNDVEDAPIWIRLRAETQHQLVGALGTQLRQATHAKLAAISNTLRLPTTSSGDGAKLATAQPLGKQ